MTEVRLAPGIYFDVPDAVYHADPCQEPSLSSGIARLLLARSPLHAWHAHPRLNPDARDRESTDAQTTGSILHKLVLGAGRALAVLDHDDFKTKAAQRARDEAVESGRIPILAHKLALLQDTAAAIVRTIRDHPDLAEMTARGHPEATLVWEEPRHGITCRARVDWLPENESAWLYDLKTTGLSAAPEEWQRKLVSDCCLQAAFYARGARRLGLRPTGMRFVVAEKDPPHGISVMAAAPSLLEYAELEVERAMATWAACLRENRWPGYPRSTAYVEAPGWLLMRQEERLLNIEMLGRSA